MDVNGTELRVAIANGGANLRRLVDSIREGKAPQYHFVEMMACRGKEPPAHLFESLLLAFLDPLLYDDRWKFGYTQCAPIAGAH